MYVWLKLVHLVAVIAFLGNITTGISGVTFMLRVAPLQRQLLAKAQGGTAAASFDYAQYQRLARRWEISGAVALLTPLAGLVLMVLKPGLASP